MIPPVKNKNTVATALTVYGIETIPSEMGADKIVTVATALTVYGIETHQIRCCLILGLWQVATALTVYGIETCWCSKQTYIGI